MTSISVQGLRVAMGGSDLVVDELNISSGETLVVFGPNGAGKTTLLRRLAGVSEGKALVDAAYLPQRPHAFRGSALRNLTLGLGEAEQALAVELAGRFGVQEVLDRPARRLSGGERHRVALARTLARPEPVVLLDEPLAPVDLGDRMDLASILASLLEGRTSIVVTHDRDEAAVLADRIAVLTEGRIRQVGTPGDVLSLPVNEAVAEVVGVSNVLRGTVRDADEGLVALDVGGISIWGLGDTASGNAVALFGAETVTVYPGEVRDAGSARNRWPGTVLEVRPAGRLVEIVVDCGAPIAALLTPGSLEALEIAEGALVTLAVKATAVRVAAR